MASQVSVHTIRHLSGTIDIPRHSGHTPWEDVGVGGVYDFRGLASLGYLARLVYRLTQAGFLDVVSVMVPPPDGCTPMVRGSPELLGHQKLWPMGAACKPESSDHTALEPQHPRRCISVIIVWGSGGGGVDRIESEVGGAGDGSESTNCKVVDIGVIMR